MQDLKTETTIVFKVVGFRCIILEETLVAPQLELSLLLGLEDHLLEHVQQLVPVQSLELVHYY